MGKRMFEEEQANIDKEDIIPHIVTVQPSTSLSTISDSFVKAEAPQKQKIELLRAQGYTQKKVADYLGLTQQWISKVETAKKQPTNKTINIPFSIDSCIRNNSQLLPLDRRRTISIEQEQEIINLLYLNKSQHEIATEFGIGQPQVSKIKQKYLGAVSKNKLNTKGYVETSPRKDLITWDDKIIATDRNSEFKGEKSLIAVGQ
jgi:transcriptional regulator with XRE-family HTH domain